MEKKGYETTDENEFGEIAFQKSNPLIPVSKLLSVKFDEALKRVEICQKVKMYVRGEQEGEGTGHDWWHSLRVSRLAKHIAKQEEADIHIVELSALLHDIADWKFTGGDETVGPAMAKECLFKAGAGKEVIDQICDIIRTISFKGAGVKNEMKIIEGKIVQDADRLDAIGAIGIARTFAYGGSRGREIYNPEIKPERHDTFEAYKNSNGPTLNHFDEKLLLLKDMLNTETAMKIAESRHRYMEQFREQFFSEWNGKDYDEE